ncbi:MAG: calcium/sodium antiporter [Gammaproteobacteria bacterium]|nr:MAG: calcium/sodium antiporter [Gammaproteobacteria bacterium]
MIPYCLAILTGFVILTVSADRFVLGASALAKNLGVPTLLVGLVIVGFGTSAPEIIVSAMAAWQGNGYLSIGNALGSNITNIGLVLGLAVLATPMQVHSSLVKKEIPVLFLVMGFSLFLLVDGRLTPADGVLLVIGTLLMLGWTVQQGLKQRHKNDPLEQEFADELQTSLSTPQAIFWLSVGMLFLLGSSKLLVWGAVGVAKFFGVSDLIIGLTIVAVGTSLPELAASVMSAIRNEHDLAIGNVIGSNMYNLLAVMACPGLLGPVNILPEILSRDFPVMIVLSLALWIMATGIRSRGIINRLEGGVLLLSFVGYQYFLFRSIGNG